MASLTVISGVGGKLPAAFLVEMEGYRLLWDLGAGPQPGVRPAHAQPGCWPISRHGGCRGMFIRRLTINCG